MASGDDAPEDVESGGGAEGAAAQRLPLPADVLAPPGEGAADKLVRVQALVRRFLTVRRVRARLMQRFEKVFDDNTGHFYYYDKETNQSQCSCGDGMRGGG
jgi:hypothetical protein